MVSRPAPPTQHPFLPLTATRQGRRRQCRDAPSVSNSRRQATGTRPGRLRPARPRTSRRLLQRWGVKHAAVLEELNAALVAMTGSARAVTAGAGEASVERAAAGVDRFLAAVGRAEALPVAPEPGAHASFARAVALWRDAGELQRESLRPYRPEGSERAVALLEEANGEFVRFAQAFSGAVA